MIPANQLLSKKILIVFSVFLALTAQSLAEVKLEGYCPVCYFTKGKAVKGSEEFQSEYKGGSYYFDTEQSKLTFDQAPEKFLPVYDGYCAYAVSLGKKVSSNPKRFTIIDGKLYLNYNWWIKKKFDKKAKEYVRSADKKWEDISKLSD